MIRFVIEKFRSSSGPLKEPRIILADIAEELLNTALEYLKKSPDEGTAFPCEQRSDDEVGAPAIPQGDEPHVAADVVPAGADDEGAQEDAEPPVQRELEIDPRLERAVTNRTNLHKQDFKVLAILWDAYQRGLVPLSAKSVSNHGERIGLAIRHENVRKVVRMRLEKYVDFHNEGAGSGTIYRYVLNAAGREYFASTYLREGER